MQHSVRETPRYTYAYAVAHAPWIASATQEHNLPLAPNSLDIPALKRTSRQDDILAPQSSRI